MSFSSDIKAEICKTEPGEICCVRAELTGIVGFGAAISDNCIRFKAEKALVTQRFFDLVKRLYAINAETFVSDGGMYCAAVNGPDALKILRDLKLATTPLHLHRDITRSECCRNAVVRGAFLGGGSVSAPEKGYHSEITTNRYSICCDLAETLKLFDVYPKLMVRNGCHVLYVKDSEQIENLLAAIGAYNKMLEFVNVKIEKEMRNTTNRRVNCEAANVTKAAMTGAVQRNAIMKIKATVGFDSLSPELLSLALLRLKLPSATLAELGARLGISKSGVNHRFRKLMAIAEKTEG